MVLAVLLVVLSEGDPRLVVVDVGDSTSVVLLLHHGPAATAPAAEGQDEGGDAEAHWNGNIDGW